MAGTVGPATKRYLLKERLPADPGLVGIQIGYSLPRDVDREVIYGGQISGPVQVEAMRGGTRITRREDLVLSLHIWVNRPGDQDTADVEARAAEIGQVVEELLAGDPTLSGAVAGLKMAAITNVLIDSGCDDDGALAELTYQISLMSHIR